MTALRHAAPPTALSDRQCPRCQHERDLRLGSERVRGLYLADLARQDEELRRLRRELAGLLARAPRKRLRWYDVPACALITAWDRLGATGERRTWLLASFVTALCFLGIAIVRGY